MSATSVVREPFFTIREVPTREGVVQYRREMLTGLRCRISTERIKRGIDGPISMEFSPDGCPFCSDLVMNMTPTFAEGYRICIGESITFPNLYPFAEHHTVTVITNSHSTGRFTQRQLADAFHGQMISLQDFRGYPSINWNYLPSAGASLSHPHLQGIADAEPTVLTERYLSACHRYLTKYGSIYWDDFRLQEEESERFLFGDELFWYANPVPIGEREVRAVLPFSTIHEFEPYLESFAEGTARILDFYRRMGNIAFNLSLFFDKTGSRTGKRSGFRAFSSIIARINPNPASLSDSAFMERIHLEPVILTLPEDLGVQFRLKG